MIPMTLGHIAALTGGVLHDAEAIPVPDGAEGPHAAAQVLVDGPVVTDSRESGPGGLYIARVGEHADGHTYIPAALAAGAVASLTTRPVAGAPTIVVPDVQEAFAALATAVIAGIDSLVVIGITGSSGKTTTKDLLAAVLSAHGETVANVGSLNSEVGVPLTVCRARPSTRYLILEMGARGVGHIRYLTDMTHPRVAVVLNVGSAHVGEFGSRAAIAAAKAELVEALPPGGLAVLNGDDPLVSAMTSHTDGREVQVVRVGTGADADVQARDIEMRPDGTARFVLSTPSTLNTSNTPSARADVPVELRLMGRHQVDNALAVAAVATQLGMTPQAVADALAAAVPASRWRMERHERPDGVTVVNDAYNANPESMAGALHTLAHLGADRRTWAVLGGMLELGDGAAQAHREVGALARTLGIDELLTVGELGRDIAAGAQADMPPSSAEGINSINTTVRCVKDTEAAFEVLGTELRQGDVVLLKSSRDSGLRHLGDRLLSVTQSESPLAKQRDQRIDSEVGS